MAWLVRATVSALLAMGTYSTELPLLGKSGKGQKGKGGKGYKGKGKDAGKGAGGVVPMDIGQLGQGEDWNQWEEDWGEGQENQDDAIDSFSFGSGQADFLGEVTSDLGHWEVSTNKRRKRTKESSFSLLVQDSQET